MKNMRYHVYSYATPQRSLIIATHDKTNALRVYDLNVKRNPKLFHQIVVSGVLKETARRSVGGK